METSTMSADDESEASVQSSTPVVLRQTFASPLDSSDKMSEGSKTDRSSRSWKNSISQKGLQVIVYLSLVVFQCANAGMAVFTKYALREHIPPLLFATLRAIIALPLLFIIGMVLDKNFGFPKSQKSCFFLFLLGMTGVVGNQVLNIYGLMLTTATVQSIIQPSIPVITMVFSFFFLKEKLSVLKICGVLLSVVGAVVMVGFSDFSSEGGIEFVAGVLLLLGNCLSFSVYLVLQKPMLRMHSPPFLTFYTYLSGGCVMFVASCYYAVTVDWSAYSSSMWFAALYAGICVTACGYLLATWAMSHTTPTIVSVFAAVQPLATAVLAFFVLGERPVWREYVAGALIVLGLLTVVFAKRREEKRAMSRKAVSESHIQSEA